MAKQLHISIPKPCHENWDEMTPTAQGAFCKSCNKNVIDFSTKTENEIYHIITNSEERMCGRFRTEQLELPVRKTELKNGWFNWRAIAASVAALFSFGKLSSAGDLEPKPKLVVENKKPVPDTKPLPKGDVIATTTQPITQVCIKMGKLKAPYIEQSVDSSIKGNVIDGRYKFALEGAQVIVKGIRLSSVTDKNGNFTLKINPEKGKLNDTLAVNAPGYETQEFLMSTLKKDKRIKLELWQPMMMGVVGEIYVDPEK